MTLRVSLLSGLALGICGLLAPCGSAEEPAAPKIGVINQERLFQEYERTKVSLGKLKSLSANKQVEREKTVSRIKSMREELILLNSDARVEKQKEIEEDLKGLAAFDRQAREGLRQEEEEELKVIFDEIESAAAEFAKAKGLDLILSDRALIFGTPALDVTDQLLKVLNDRYQKSGKR